MASYKPVPTCDDDMKAAELAEANEDGGGIGSDRPSVVGVQRWVDLQADMYGWLLSTVAREKVATREFVAQFVLLVGNFSMQIFFVQCVQWLNKDFVEHSSSCACTLLIQWVAVFFWELEMWSEITETLDMAELIYYVPNTSKSDSSEGHHLMDNSVWQTCLNVSQGSNLQRSAGLNFWKRQSSKDHSNVHEWSPEECLEILWPGHLERPRKMFLVISLLVPKLMVAVLLSYIGGVYIFLSKNDEVVILSVVAAEFVLRIDQILFSSFAIPEVSSLMKKAQPIGFHMSEGTFWTQWRTSSFLCMTVDPLLVFMISYAILVFGVEEEKCPSEAQWWL